MHPSVSRICAFVKRDFSDGYGTVMDMNGEHNNNSNNNNSDNRVMVSNYGRMVIEDADNVVVNNYGHLVVRSGSGRATGMRGAKLTISGGFFAFIFLVLKFEGAYEFVSAFFEDVSFDVLKAALRVALRAKGRW